MNSDPKKPDHRARLIDWRLGGRRVRLSKGRGVMFAYPVVAVIAVIYIRDRPANVLSALFLWGCLLYPLIYLACWGAASVLQARKRRIAALWVSGVPLQYLGLVGALALLDLVLEGTGE